MSTSTSEIIVAISVVFSVVCLIGICIVAHKYYLLMEEIRREESNQAKRYIALKNKQS